MIVEPRPAHPKQIRPSSPIPGAIANNAQSQLVLHPVIKKLLALRSINSQEEINEFFSWDLKFLSQAPNLRDLDRAAWRIVQALENKESIGIYGDYDVDGTTSCALFYQFFLSLGVKVDLVQPSRFVEGYGLHLSSIEDAVEKKIKVLITVDCGITSLEAADLAVEKNLDLIITDHHKDARERLPHAYAIVNPNRRDEDQASPYKALAGVGVAFMVCLRVREILLSQGKSCPTLYPLLSYVAIGTIADLAPLNSVNKKLVRHGLKQIPKTQWEGIKVFLSSSDQELDFLPSEKIAFTMGPYINSKGRLDHPENALKMLIADNHSEAFRYYCELETSNRMRKEIQAQVFEEAKKQVLSQYSHNLTQGPPLINIVYAPHWHEGVIGIVASKLVESFQIPAIVFCDSEKPGVIKASARSAGQLNLFDCLQQCQELFIKFGGHHAAAGLSMPREHLEILKTKLNQQLTSVPEILRKNQITFDLQIDFQEIDYDLIKQLQMMEPFGMGNPLPLFKIENVTLKNFTILKDVHVKWFFTGTKNRSASPQILSGLSFNYIGKWNSLAPTEIQKRSEKESLILYATLGLNKFRGNETIQLMAHYLDFSL
jgi:single-stranded-DNA-specific exonuclease